MPRSATLAFSPGSVTCFFRPEIHEDPAQTVSRGCGICLTDGVAAAVRPANANRMTYNGRDLEIASVTTVVAELAPEPVRVDFDSPLPIGCGFGVSAACALSTAFALAKRFDLPHDRRALGRFAHSAEVRHRTGLGDVCAQLCGGVAFRHCRTGPLDAEQIVLSTSDVYYRAFGDMKTVKVLTTPELLAKIQLHGDTAMAWLEERKASVTLEQLLERSLEFDEATGLIADGQVRQAIDEIHSLGGKAAMILLGRSVIATRPGANPADWVRCRIDRAGTRLL